MTTRKSVAVAFVVTLWAWTTTANAAELATNMIRAVDTESGGEIVITSTVSDNYLGDFSKYHFDYFVENNSYDPSPGSTNGLSGFQVVFLGPVPGVADQYAPADWVFNCCGTIPPFGAEADIDNTTGFGILVGGSGSFGFSTPAGVTWTDAFTGSWVHSWEGDVQTLTFEQVDADNASLSILTPVPEPSGILLVSLGSLLLARKRNSWRVRK